MSKFLPCKKVCPVVAELKHDVANRDCEIKRLYGVIDHRDGVIDELLGELRKLTSELRITESTTEACERKLAKIRQIASRG